MTHSQFESLLKQAIGLDAASIGISSIERAVQARASACKANDIHSYWEMVNTSAAELQELVEAVIVPETWFFRDRDAFEALAHIAQEKWLTAHSQGILKLLSLPCSSGEEPCSMAMALLDAGFPPSRCRIDAVDISAQMLARAERALYGKNSFRSSDLSFRDRHFEKSAHGYQLSEAVRQQVRYQHCNLFDANFLPGTAIYDIIFCRNLLIYFDRPTQDRAIEVLQRLMTPEGVLFVGPAETALLLSHSFISIKVPLAFAFRKGATVSPEKASAPAHPIRKLQPRPTNARHPVAHKSAPARPAEATPAPRHRKPAPSSAAADSELDEAAKLADQGHLTEAAQSCEEHLHKHGPSVRALHLMGLVRAAADDLASAAQYYRKALYLDPNYHDTLLHLGLLLDKQGDAAGARVVRGRLLRLQASTRAT
jgi:chemotaxis protein methyltransferase WspC